MKTVAIAQARMGSTRLPGKVMTDLFSRPVLGWAIDAIKAADGIDEVVLATSTLPADDEIERWCRNFGVACFRGSESDVLDRFYQCAKQYKADIVLRLTCDCPFLDPAVISEVVRLRAMTGTDYASNIDPPSYPDGLDVECFTFRALEAAWNEATSPTDRDCVPQFIVRNRSRFPAANLRCPLPGMEKERWVLDTADDLVFCREVAGHLTKKTPSYLDILQILDRWPGIRKANEAGIRNERFYEGISTERLPPRTFERSERVHRRAMERIPFGAQTFSKSHLQFPAGAAPLCASHGDGPYLFDVDGNRYVDLVNAILPVVLGYRDPDVDESIRRQLDSGISLSLPTELEAELAEMLCRLIPSAEMVKFGKSGTDVTTAAIRLARAYTGRSKVLVGGYHGWADWSMAVTDRNLGIPAEVAALSQKIPFGDIGALLPINGHQVAAVIVEPTENYTYLKELRAWCDKYGVVLIFDEVITGFRYSIGGAQKLFDITPDLSTFGKAMANGMPLSAVVGRRDIMKLCEPPNNIFYSGTMFGEALSLAAAIATIKKMEREDTVGKLWSIGQAIYNNAQNSISSHGLDAVVTLTGAFPRVMVSFTDSPAAKKSELASLYMQEMLANGVLVINSHNVSSSIGRPQIERIKTAYDATMASIRAAIENGDISARLKGRAVTTTPLRSAS